MGVSTESSRMTARQPGIALPATIFGIVMVALLSGSIWALTDLETRATTNRQDGVSAMHIAEAGAAHALSILRNQVRDTSFTRLLRGFDNSGTANADDGILDGYAGVTSSINIPTTGRTITGGTYYAQVLDDPADGDGNARADANKQVILRCTGVTTRGGRAVIEMVLRDLASVPAIAFGTTLTISGNPTVSGGCGDVHANGNLTLTGTTTVNASASSSANGTGNYTAGGSSYPAVDNAPLITIPPYTATSLCTSADYVMQTNGWILRRSDNTLHNATSTQKFGWKRSSTSPVIYDADLDAMTTGSFCVEGNVNFGKNPGSSGSHLPLSIFAKGSIEYSGNGYLRAEDASGVVLLADGDLKINGNPTLSNNSISFGGSNCSISGNPVITGQFICAGGALPSGAKDLISSNDISGNPTINYNCGASSDPSAKRRIMHWYQRMNM